MASPAPIRQLGLWFHGVVQGHYSYQAIPGNTDVLEASRTPTAGYWLHAIRRRSQRHRLRRDYFGRIVNRWLPQPSILQPDPNQSFFAKHLR